MTWQKRLFDLILVGVLGVLLGPVLIVLLGWLYIKEGRPLFYVAERMKAPGQPFALWKLRTMTVVDADQGVSGGNKASRITKTGAFLRSKRLDEFPQLWNILRGDISFVGPRPPLREYVEKFPDLYGEVLKSRPGVTGLASIRFHKHEERLLARCQSSAQTEAVYARICVPRKAALDLIYQRHQSLCFDISVIVETAKGVVKRRNSAEKS